mmetsp:Transcript_44697/g.83468  ORF Transcript_44697/g.83468 Transcript_44697/m.83468 type:complete len:300 (-) Transcript_44697:137-1036(-)
MPFVACGCLCGIRELELLLCNRRLWVRLKEPTSTQSNGKDPDVSFAEPLTDYETLMTSEPDALESKQDLKFNAASDAESAPSWRKLCQAFPDAPKAELARFARGWSPDAAVKAYSDHIQWRQGDGSPESLEEARRAIPAEWLGRGTKAKDGSDVLLLQVARTDCRIPAETYFKALCSVLEDIVPRDADSNFKRITLVMDTRGGEGWNNPPATQMLPLVRICARQFPPNYPGTLQRIVIYPVPTAFRLFARVALAFVDPVTRNRVVLISEKHEGGFEKAAKEYISKDSLPEYSWARHRGL